MKINNLNRYSNNKRRRYIVIIVTVICLSVISYGAYWYFYQQNKDDKPALTLPDRQVGETDYSHPTKDEQNPTSDNDDNNQKKLTPQQNAPATLPIPVSITRVDRSPLQVGVIINELLSSGTCTLKLSKPGLSDITQTVEIFNGPSYTTCRGFSIDNVPGGTWKLTIIINSENRSGSTSQEITI